MDEKLKVIKNVFVLLGTSEYRSRFFASNTVHIPDCNMDVGFIYRLKCPQIKFRQLTPGWSRSVESCVIIMPD
jgi:hypothetical protein